MTKKKSINVKDYLDDDSLDLSLCNLQDVPVKEIASVPKAIKVDLSSNNLAVLGNNFAGTLAHLVKLDLSTNQLTELPDNFGLLVNLKHLDLYKNKLQTLPASFGNLRSLRWLDLKENPLVPKMAQVAGTCLDQQECQAAARNVVRFMIEWQREKEEENKRKEQERLERLIIEEQKALKREAKQKRKKNRKNALKNAENAMSEVEINGAAVVEEIEPVEPMLISVGDPPPKVSFFGKVSGFLSWLFKFLVISSLLTALLLFIISLLDDKLYIRCLRIFRNALSSANIKIPLIYPKTFPPIISWVYIWVQSVTVNVVFLLSLCTKTLTEFYQVVTTDERVLNLMKDSIKWLQISYIKVIELSAVYFQKLVLLIQSYVK